MHDVVSPAPAIDVRLFSALREKMGCGSVTVVADGPMPVDELLRRMADDHPTVKAFLSCIRVAVNQEYVGETHVVHPGDEVALITPVSGG